MSAQTLKDTVPRISDAEIQAYAEASHEAQWLVAPDEYQSEVIQSFAEPDRASVQSTPFPKLAGLFDLRPGELTIWAAYNGHRKSMLTSQFVLYAMAQGKQACIASMEMHPRKTLKRMCVQAARTKQPDTGYLVRWFAWVSQYLRMYDQMGTIHPDRIVSLARYYGGALHGDLLVIDSLMKCGVAEDDAQGMQRFMDSLTSAARDTGLHIILVHHVRKAIDETKIPGKMDLKGTGNLSDQADNVIIQWTDKEKPNPKPPNDTERDGLLKIEKQRNGEWEGAISLWFDDRSLHHVDARGMRPFDWQEVANVNKRK